MSEEVQTFRATNGRVTGVIGLVMCATVAVLLVLTEHPSVAVPGILGCAFVAVLVWAALLRPRVVATAQELRMWTVVDQVSIPLASIDTVAVRRYLLVRAGGVKYICPAISRSLRKTVRSEMRWQGGSQILAPGLQPGDLSAPVRTKEKGSEGDGLDYADFVETEIVRLADADRVRRGIEARSEEEYELGSEVVRRRSWVEVAALAVLAVAFVVALLV
jgi:hypothetical protein